MMGEVCFWFGQKALRANSGNSIIQAKRHFVNNVCGSSVPIFALLVPLPKHTTYIHVDNIAHAN